MKKYEELQEKYREEIARIKGLMAGYLELVTQANAINPVTNPPDFEAIARQDALFEKATRKYYAWSSALEMLHQDIEAEYHDVPFSKARTQGMARFYELAGLQA